MGMGGMTVEIQVIKDLLHSAVMDGGALHQVVDAIQNQLESFQRTADLVNYSLKIDTAWGSDVDKIIALMSTRRYPAETDVEVKDRMDDWVTDTKGRFQTVAALQTLVYEIAEYIPDIDEYPDVDFMTDYGTPTNYGICRMQVPGNKSEYLSDIATMGQTYVAAGIYLIVESTTDLVDMINNFSDDPFFYGSLSFDESDPGMTDEWMGYINHFQTESLTSFNEELIQYGLLIYTDELITLSDMLELQDILVSYTESSTSFNDVIIGYIDYYETESLTSFIDDMNQYGLLAFSNSVTTLSDVLELQDILISYTESLTTFSSIMTGYMSMTQTEALVNKPIFTIGSSKIGSSDIIGSGAYPLLEYRWGTAVWGTAVWGDDESRLNIGEIF